MKIYTIVIHDVNGTSPTNDVFLTKRGVVKFLDKIEADLPREILRNRADEFTLCCQENGDWWTLAMGEVFLHL